MIKVPMDKNHNHTCERFARTMRSGYFKDERKDKDWLFYAVATVTVVLAACIILFVPSPSETTSYKATKVANKACPDTYTPIWENQTTVQCLREK